jgi:hypothetical protein
MLTKGFLKATGLSCGALMLRRPVKAAPEMAVKSTHRAES